LQRHLDTNATGLHLNATAGAPLKFGGQLPLPVDAEAVQITRDRRNIGLAGAKVTARSRGDRSLERW